MKKVYSKYKFFGGFGLLIGLNLLFGFASYKLLTASKISLNHGDLLNDSDARFAYTIIIGLNLLFLLLFITQSQFIIINTVGITFINPLIPLLRKTRIWSDFDYYITVDENSRYSTHEAVWLIKNGKLKGRFSSFYYTNYYEIKSQIKTKKGGKKYFNPFSQFFIILGIKRIKTEPNKAQAPYSAAPRS